METVSRLELGKHPPRVRTIRAIGKALNVDPKVIEFSREPNPEAELAELRGALTEYLRKKWVDAVGKLDEGRSAADE